MKQRKNYQIALASTLAAFSVVLDQLSLRTDTSKYTIYALPLLLAGMLYGPTIGAFAGFAAGFISQLIGYGLMPTTFLWVIAPCAWGFISGIIAKIFKHKNLPIQIIINVFITSVCVLFINSLALILDGYIYHYSTAFVYASLLTRFIVSLFIGTLYSIIIILINSRLNFNKKQQTSNENSNLKINVEQNENILEIELRIKL